MNNQNDTYTFLSHQLPFWEHLNDTQKYSLTQSLVLTHYEKNSSIHFGENDCIGMLIIKEGLIRTFLMSEAGKEVTLYRLSKGDVCILSASCILHAITFDVYINAAQDCDIYHLSTKVIAELMTSSIYFEAYAYKLAAERFSDVMWAMQQILFMSFDKRLAIFLLDESASQNFESLKITHEEIARYLGSAREVVTRMLKYFSLEGLVELSRGGITILDRKGLKRIVEVPDKDAK